jgi:hypothetical protein
MYNIKSCTDLIMSVRKYECPKCRPTDTEHMCEILTTDCNVAVFQ